MVSCYKAKSSANSPPLCCCCSSHRGCDICAGWSDARQVQVVEVVVVVGVVGKPSGTSLIFKAPLNIRNFTFSHVVWVEFYWMQKQYLKYLYHPVNYSHFIIGTQLHDTLPSVESTHLHSFLLGEIELDTFVQTDKLYNTANE